MVRLLHFLFLRKGEEFAPQFFMRKEFIFSKILLS